MAVAAGLVATGGVVARGARECERELDQALDALGPYGQTAGGEQIRQWSGMLRQRIAPLLAQGASGHPAAGAQAVAVADRQGQGAV